MPLLTLILYFEWRMSYMLHEVRTLQNLAIELVWFLCIPMYGCIHTEPAQHTGPEFYHDLVVNLLQFSKQKRVRIMRNSERLFEA
jgi:hypothetical protein